MGMLSRGRDTTRIWILHKPVSCVTTHSDPEGRKRVFDLLPDHLGHVISVGRLDINSEGLLILTNNGDLARHLDYQKPACRVRIACVFWMD